MDDRAVAAEGTRRQEEILARCAEANARAAAAVERAEAAVTAAHARLRHARATLDAIEDRTAHERADRVASV